MSVTLTVLKNKVAILELNRPEKHNAFDSNIIDEMIKCISHANTLDIRALVLKTVGKNFSAGADLAWMKSMANNDYKDNIADSKQLAKLMSTLAHCPHPTICLIQGAAFGGALGLICCCDIAIARSDAKLCLSEVKLGLIPAVISPYVIKAMGERQARRYFLTAEIIDAEKALSIGLIHEIHDDLDIAQDTVLDFILSNGPEAVSAAKRLISDVSGLPISSEVIEMTAKRIANIRVSPEGQEGLASFFEKRPAHWQVENKNKSGNI